MLEAVAQWQEGVGAQGVGGTGTGAQGGRRAQGGGSGRARARRNRGADSRGREGHVGARRTRRGRGAQWRRCGYGGRGRGGCSMRGCPLCREGVRAPHSGSAAAAVADNPAASVAAAPAAVAPAVAVAATAARSGAAGSVPRGWLNAPRRTVCSAAARSRGLTNPIAGATVNIGTTR
jgi:hypothetical protein